MTDLEDQKTQKLLRGIVREETRKIVQEETRKIVQEETRKIVQEETRKIVREETADMRADVKTIKQVQGAHSIQLQTMQADLRGVNHSLRGQQKETHRLGVLFEDLDNRFAAVAELP